MIKDSFAVPVYSFLSLGVQELQAIDLRYFSESVVDYINDARPDVVVVLYNADSLSPVMFQF